MGFDHYRKIELALDLASAPESSATGGLPEAFRQFAVCEGPVPRIEAVAPFMGLPPPEAGLLGRSFRAGQVTPIVLRMFSPFQRAYQSLTARFSAFMLA